MKLIHKKIKTVFIFTDSESDQKAELTLYPNGNYEILRIKVSNEDFINEIIKTIVK